MTRTLIAATAAFALLAGCGDAAEDEAPTNAADRPANASANSANPAGTSSAAAGQAGYRSRHSGERRQGQEWGTSARG